MQKEIVSYWLRLKLQNRDANKDLKFDELKIDVMEIYGLSSSKNLI